MQNDDVYYPPEQQRLLPGLSSRNRAQNKRTYLVLNKALLVWCWVGWSAPTVYLTEVYEF